VTDPAGGVVEYRYNPRRMLETIVSPTGGATNYTYDALGRLETVRDPAGVLTAYAYDVPLRRASVSVGGVTTFNFFDNVGRLWQSETPAAGAKIIREFYDNGQVRAEIDPNANRAEFTYDRLGRVATTTDARGGVTRFEYDGAGRRTAVTDPANNVTRYTYDLAGRLAQEIDSLNLTTSYGYDPAGNVTSIMDRRGWQRQFDYDADDRLTAERWYTGVSLVRSMAFSYNLAGDLLSASDPDSSYTFSYDAAGRPITVDNSGTPSVPRVVLTNTFDASGNRTRLDDSLGGYVTTQYDSANRPTLITQAGAGITTKQVGFTYNNRGQFASIGRSENGSLITQANYTYDSAAGEKTGGRKRDRGEKTGQV
jgi:YD repeat-containing protein